MPSTPASPSNGKTPSTGPTAESTGNPGARRPSAGRFLYRHATPLTTGLFAVSAVSGVALFFHWASATFHSMHEWLSMALLLPFALHVWRNWRPLVSYAKKGPLTVALVLSVLVAVPFALSTPARGGRGNPGFQAVTLITQAPLMDLAPLLRTTPEALLASLRQRGYAVDSGQQSLAAIASANGKPPAEVLQAVLPARTGAAGSVTGGPPAGQRAMQR